MHLNCYKISSHKFYSLEISFLKKKIMKYLYFLLFISFANLSIAQDDYHTNLANTLSTQYNLPTGEWLIQNTEIGILNEITNYGGSETNIDVSGQDFTKASQMVISNAGNNAWDAGWKLDNNISVQNNEKVLFVFWIRSEGGPGKVNLFAERASDFAKEIYVPINLTEEWSQYFVPINIAFGNHNVGQLDFGFHTGIQAQTIQIGGFTAIKYSSSVDIEDLPADLNNDEYEGFQLDAPWRTAAADRIDNLRKANLTINAVTSAGTPVSNAAIDIQMTRHEFAFGSAITAARIAGNNDQNVFYENKIRNLDGQGHGFNWVVFENDMKWDGWESEWFVTNSELVNAVSWLDERDIKIRGHNLVWPGWDLMPDDIQANSNNPTYIWNRIESRLNEILTYPGLESDKIPEWDVLNEIVTITSLEAPFSNYQNYVTGRELYADIFKKAKQISPNTKMYYNDYVTMTLGNTSGAQYDKKKARIQELLDAGAPLEGIGFQGHIGGFPNGIPGVLGTLDDFYDSFGLTAKITEFDMPPSISEELGANYLRDFLTAIFSHESVDGFLFWNFWDGATWMNPGTNLFRDDWSRTPAGDMFVDLVFNQWWTNAQVETDANGNFTDNFFRGTHEITYVCNGQTIIETINLVNDETITITCDDFQTDIDDLTKSKISIYPNPAQDFFTIKRENSTDAIVRLFDPRGVKVSEHQISNSLSEIKVEVLKGVYFVEILEGENRYFQKMIFN